ncbi:flagellar motor protein MotB [Cohnella sp. GCM10012308]|uniref:flagellar motor protein MotB n=1 Tax=Cohnella sp. GCM10012308 TaxID=3317329 RepID=UPI00362015CE
MARRRSRRSRSAHENQERWLITYADLITLLLIFFIIMYAMSQIDIKKYDTLAKSLQLEFSKADSIIEMGSGLEGGTDVAKYASPPPSANPSPSASASADLDAEIVRRREQALQDLLKVIESYVKENKLQQDVFVGDTPQGIAIRLSDRFLFDLGKADLKPDARPALDKLSSLFTKLDTTISIQGHTDNLPIQPGSAFQDNWGLSSGRALSVLRYFVDTRKLPEKIFEIAGYADTRPVAANDTEANRQKNRRVEILVVRQAESAT